MLYFLQTTNYIILKRISAVAVSKKYCRCFI